MQNDGTKRCNLNLQKKTIRGVDAFASTYSLSRTRAIEELLKLGMDAEISGIDSTLAMQSKIKHELDRLCGLVATTRLCADAAASISILIGFKNGDLKTPADAHELYIAARKFASNELQKMKKDV